MHVPLSCFLLLWHGPLKLPAPSITQHHVDDATFHTLASVCSYARCAHMVLLSLCADRKTPTLSNQSKAGLGACRPLKTAVHSQQKRAQVSGGEPKFDTKLVSVTKLNLGPMCECASIFWPQLEYIIEYKIWPHVGFTHCLCLGFICLSRVDSARPVRQLPHTLHGTFNHRISDPVCTGIPVEARAIMCLCLPLPLVATQAIRAERSPGMFPAGPFQVGHILQCLFRAGFTGFLTVLVVCVLKLGLC